MGDPETKEYIVVAQCHIVKERCSGYLCEKAFNERSGGFSIYPKDKPYRIIYLTCGGCCGRALHRKLTHLLRALKKEGIEKDKVAVQFSSCIAKDNFHAPPCPHFDYLKELVNKTGLDFFESSKISACSEKRRQQGIYHS